MDVQATTDSPLSTGADTIAIGIFDGEAVAHELPGGGLSELIASGEASTELGRTTVLHAPEGRLILAGLGARERFDAERARVGAAAAEGRAAELATGSLCWELPHHVGDEVAEGLVEGTLLHAYRFERYNADPAPRGLERLLISAHHDVSEPVRTATVMALAQNRARDLGNTPANDLTPVLLAQYARERAGQLSGVSVTVMDEQQIRDAGMGAFAAVARGSDEPAQLIALEYEGPAADRSARLGLIGKAVTFDSGGLALKPSSDMHEMKFDMCGGAAVIEAIGALYKLRAPVRVLGIVGATENMPSGHAVRPGDIVRALDGTTIEIENPDAEGRLVLADCISHARASGCGRLIDVATLTGAIVTALGSTYAGMMANDDAWAAVVTGAAQRAGEPVWRMPLHEHYAEMVKGRYAQPSTAPSAARLRR